MAIKGLTIPAFANYNYDGNKVTYTNGFICGSAIEYGAEIETSDDNPLYGDDKIIEHDYGTFSTGTLTLNTSDLTQKDSKRLLNLKEIQTQIGDVQVTELIYDDDAKASSKGFGIIETHQINDVDKYRALILCKVTPKNPAEAATTKGESIEWQTKELECGIERSDEETGDMKKPWKREAWFDNHADALEYIKTILNVMDPVEAVSQAGTEEGKTKITIKNPVAGADYKYSKTGPTPTYKQDLTQWTEFESGEEIEATDGSTIYIAQTDASKKAVGAGEIIVVANTGV